MSDTAALISASLILMSLYTTFQLGIECERERARKARSRRYNEEDTE